MLMTLELCAAPQHACCVLFCAQTLSVPIGGRDMELEFEIPFRELGFSGVPHRTASNVMPTVNCLVGPRLQDLGSMLIPHNQQPSYAAVSAWQGFSTMAKVMQEY